MPVPCPPLPSEPATRLSITSRVYVALLLCSTLAVLAMTGLALWMSAATNRLAAANSLQLVSIALGAAQERVATMTEDFAKWDEAYGWIMAGDAEALDAHIGASATEAKALDAIVLVSPGGQPLHVYEAEAGRSGLAAAEIPVKAALLDALARRPVEPYETVSAPYVQDGALVLAAAGRIQPHDASGLRAEDLPVMIGALRLDGDDLRHTGANLLLGGLRLLAPDTPPAPGHGALPVPSPDGTPVAALSWRLPRPGDRLFNLTLPAIAVVSVALLFGSVFAGRVSARQTASIQRERRMARTDGLTGLLNRSGLQEAAQAQMVVSALGAGEAAVLYFDINGFKRLNDTLGHDGGDIALAIIADILRGSMRRDDLVARIGGDEFVAALLGPAAAEAAMMVCDRIVLQTARPFRINGQQCRLCASIGIAMPDAGTSWQEMLVRADAAMYEAKRSGRTAPVVFSAQIFPPAVRDSRSIDALTGLA